VLDPSVCEQPATLAKVGNNCVFNLILVLEAKKVIGKEDLPAIFPEQPAPTDGA
jgi:hypothetical protein